MRGLKAPPRKIVAPAFLTASPMVITWSGLSMASGPAIKTKLSPPMTECLVVITVSSGWKSRDDAMAVWWLVITSIMSFLKGASSSSDNVLTPANATRLLWTNTGLSGSPVLRLSAKCWAVVLLFAIIIILLFLELFLPSTGDQLVG